jgi:hypothetical protein
MILSNRFPLKISISEFNHLDYISEMTMSMGEINSKKFESIIRYVCINYDYLFEEEIFIKKLPDNSNTNIISFLIPFVRRVYSKFFIDPPTFTYGTNDRLIVFQHMFNLEEIVLFFKGKIIKNLNILDDFKNIDKYQSILSIICDDYVSMKISEVQKISNIKLALRNLKIDELGVKDDI